MNRRDPRASSAVTIATLVACLAVAVAAGAVLFGLHVTGSTDSVPAAATPEAQVDGLPRSDVGDDRQAGSAMAALRHVFEQVPPPSNASDCDSIDTSKGRFFGLARQMCVARINDDRGEEKTARCLVEAKQELPMDDAEMADFRECERAGLKAVLTSAKELQSLGSVGRRWLRGDSCSALFFGQTVLRQQLDSVRRTYDVSKDPDLSGGEMARALLRMVADAQKRAAQIEDAIAAHPMACGHLSAPDSKPGTSAVIA